MKGRNLDQELEDLVYFEERGGGFGDPSARESHNRKIEEIKHQQFLRLEKKNTTLALVNTILAILNIVLMVYQVFFITRD